MSLYRLQYDRITKKASGNPKLSGPSEKVNECDKKLLDENIGEEVSSCFLRFEMIGHPDQRKCR